MCYCTLILTLSHLFFFQDASPFSQHQFSLQSSPPAYLQSYLGTILNLIKLTRYHVIQIINP